MNITALTSTGQQTRVIQRPNPLLSVMAWEPVSYTHLTLPTILRV